MNGKARSSRCDIRPHKQLCHLRFDKAGELDSHRNEYSFSGKREFHRFKSNESAVLLLQSNEPVIFSAIRSALTIGTSYVIGGLVPLAPYMLMHDSGRALGVSAAITLLALAVFGFVKGHFTGVPKLKGALQTALVGSLAAAVAYLIAKFIA